MVSPGFLENVKVKAWLGGIEPAWTMLSLDSFRALGHVPSDADAAVLISTALTVSDCQQSAVTRNALLLLGVAAEGPGLKLTATGNLSRAVVAEMFGKMDWPAFDRLDVRAMNKVLNETDFFPLYYVRELLAAAKLLRRSKGYFRPTPAARKITKEQNAGGLQAQLFQLAIWHMDFDFFSTTDFGCWPLMDAGVVLWSLSVAASDWRSAEDLTRLCTVPINGVLDSTWNSGEHLLNARVLRPLWQFGLLEHRREDVPGKPFQPRHFFRKTALFDRFLSFNVEFEPIGGLCH